MRAFGRWIPVPGVEPRRGGSGTVRICVDMDGHSAAVKVLDARNPTAERYRRFVAEVDFLRSPTAQRPGVVRLLDAFVPAVLERGERAWLAMPVGVPIDEALGLDAQPGDVIRAIAEIAETLAALQEHGIYHRDLKPSNLLRVDDEWALADFGLVEYPERENLTAPGRPPGSRNYIAPELEVGRADVDFGRSDVYSLAKTLWVLVSRQRYPYPGPQRAVEAAYNLTQLLNDPRLRPIDRLIEAATYLEPETRPSMAEFARELQMFDAPVVQHAEQEEDERLRRAQERILEHTRVADDMLADRRAQGEAARIHQYWLRDAALRPAYAAFLRSVGSIGAVGPRTGQELEESTEIFDRWGFASPTSIMRYAQVSAVRTQGGRLAALAGYEILSSVRSRMTAALVVEVPFGGTAIVWHASSEFVAGTRTAEEEVARLAEGLRANLARTLERFEALLDRAEARARIGTGDAAAPELAGFAVENVPVVLSGSGGFVTFRAHIVDRAAGVADTTYTSSPSQVRFRNPAGTQFMDALFQPGRNLADGDSFDGTYIEHVRMQPQFESGEWVVEQFLLCDQVGNMHRHVGQSLEDLGLPTRFTVV